MAATERTRKIPLLGAIGILVPACFLGLVREQDSGNGTTASPESAAEGRRPQSPSDPRHLAHFLDRPCPAPLWDGVFESENFAIVADSVEDRNKAHTATGNGQSDPRMQVEEGANSVFAPLPPGSNEGMSDVHCEARLKILVAGRGEGATRSVVLRAGPFSRLCKDGDKEYVCARGVYIDKPEGPSANNWAVTEPANVTIAPLDSVRQFGADESQTAECDAKGCFPVASNREQSQGDSTEGDGTCLSEVGAPAGMIRIPGGTFEMGDDKLADSKPRTKVTLGPYYFDRTQVTVAQYARCVKAGKCEPQETPYWPGLGSDNPAPRQLAQLRNGQNIDLAHALHERNQYGAMMTAMASFCNWGVPDRVFHPMNCVDWLNASAYCKFAGSRLPTEAEWEFAGRGTDGRKYPWGNEAPDDFLRWSQLDSTERVGSHPSWMSPLGAHEMASKVMEWVEDAFARYPGHAVKNPKVEKGSIRVARGTWSGWHATGAPPPNIALRFPNPPSNRAEILGFRCARDLEGGDESGAPSQVPQREVGDSERQADGPTDSRSAENSKGNRFHVQGACDSVYDRTTHLTWQRWIEPETMSARDATFYCRRISIGSAIGWRVPSQGELSSLVDSAQFPRIDSTAFPLAPAEPFIAIDISYHPAGPMNESSISYDTRQVSFRDGSTIAVNQGGRVRCVRGEQPAPALSPHKPRKRRRS